VSKDSSNGSGKKVKKQERGKEKTLWAEADQGGSNRSFLRALALAKLHPRASSRMWEMISCKDADF
jgi:hypothetical protein